MTYTYKSNFYKAFFILIIFQFTFFTAFPEGKDENFESLNLFYLDNSRLTANDGLTAPMIKHIIGTSDSLVKDTSQKYFLFSSNGNSPFISTTPAGSTEYLKLLYSSKTSYPEINNDLILIRNALYKTPFTISNQLNFSFYLSDNLCKTNNSELSKLFCSFAREISAMINYKGEINLTVYYSNITQEIKAEDLERKMCFYNSKEEIKPKIKFSAIQLK